MEDKNENKIQRLSLISKNQLNFGIEYSNKISKLKVFIYGLKGVSLILIILSIKHIAWSRNLKKFDIIRNYSSNSL